MATSDEVRRRIEAFARQLTEEFGEVDEADGDCWLDAVENQALEISDAVHAALLKNRSLDRASAEEASCPQCGNTSRFRGMRERELISRRGPTTIAEPEYYCPCCRKAFFPADPGHRG